MRPPCFGQSQKVGIERWQIVELAEICKSLLSSFPFTGCSRPKAKRQTQQTNVIAAKNINANEISTSATIKTKIISIFVTLYRMWRFLVSFPLIFERRRKNSVSANTLEPHSIFYHINYATISLTFYHSIRLSSCQPKPPHSRPKLLIRSSAPPIQVTPPPHHPCCPNSLLCPAFTLIIATIFSI